ncbi:MAG: ATP-binding protein [Lachnospiraceae bacterium]|nr:ATP-binding protein [Lachnospiraceae bacterium]
MGSYIYLNKSDIYNHFNRLDEAVQAFETSIRDYDGLTFLPDDTLICGVALFYKVGDREKYTSYVKQILDKLSDMYPCEFIDACRVVFECSLDSGNYPLAEKIVHKMDSYMLTHPTESKVGVKIEQLKYMYAKTINDRDAMLEALEKKNEYYEQIVSTLEYQRTVSMDEYLETHKHLQEAVQNEMQANRAKTRFLANMSHDIRTPMNAIVGITNLMEHALHDPGKLENYLSKMKLSSRHLLGLINDLLDMNKIESGTTQLHIEPIRLAEQVQQIQDLVRTQINAKGQHFTILTRHIRHENLLADGVRLRQILLNVLSNSVKYTQKNGTITLELEEFDSTASDRAAYRFTITDTGMGMDADLVAHIFEPFKRGEDSVINKIQGTGLGMAITKSIVDLMGGTIRIDSEVDHGTCVTIELEFAVDQKEDAHTEPLKLLFLSKDREWMQELEAAAKIRGMTFSGVTGEEEACKVLQRSKMDAVLFCGDFCHTVTAGRLREIASPDVLFLAVEDGGHGQMAGRLRQRGFQGKIDGPFFFSNVEKEVNRIRSNNDGETMGAGTSILNGMRFLCAEDNELNAEILEASLEIAGASCYICADGAELVKRFQAAAPGDYDAILMDIQMPNMNGYEASERIRNGENPLGRTIPIIAMTANAFVEDVNNSFAAGMDAHISKPIDMADLESTMRRLRHI